MREGKAVQSRAACGWIGAGRSCSGNKSENAFADRRTLFALPGAFQIDQNFSDPMKRLMSTALKNGATAVNSHAYVYNNGGQRTKQTLTDSSYVDYAYDNLGQLDTALTKTSAGAAVSGQQFDYGYDAGWNMTNRATGAGTSAYTVNDRNQATSVAGYAQSYNALGNRTQEMTGTTTSFDYTYDAENQLISVATDTYGTPDANRWKMEFVYDGRGRMRIRKDYIWLTGAWYPNGEQRYVYDGMRLLQQRSSGNVPQVSYTRGLDLSGSLEGAGGIGGLLARSTHATTSPYAVNSSAYYHADGNGNITYLLRSDAAANASYKYDPFGRLLSSSGTLAAANVMRFSSKPIFLSSLGTWGDYYYGYRFYDPESQRWLNRDPLKEGGGETIRRLMSASGRANPVELTQGPNTYSFVRNSPTINSDAFGLSILNFFGVDGHCCNNGDSDEWSLVAGVWRRLAPGECSSSGWTVIDQDCDGMTCNGGFYYVDDVGSISCDGGKTNCEDHRWTPGSGNGRPPGPGFGSGGPHRGAPDLPEYVFHM